MNLKKMINNIRIRFEITDIPKEEQKKYPTLYLEGILKIYVNEITFFDQSGILLIEFAIFINRWLNIIKKGEYVDLIYNTMDNDEPILSFNYVKDNYYRIYSVWQETEVSELLIKENIVVEFEKYLVYLNNELKSKEGIDLNFILCNLDK
ncbi:MAG: hypothetical protein ACK4M1_12460 [Flavobacterium sp.]